MADRLPSQRLTTWKEIAEYIGRDSRTAKRYEVDRRLPVRRMPNGAKSTVYAFKHELDLWLAGNEGPAADIFPQSPSPQPAVPEAAPPQAAAPRLQQTSSLVASHGPRRRRPAAALGLTAVALIALAAFGVAARALTVRVDPKVLQLYANGRAAWERRTPDDLNKAIDDFTRAIVLDPHYAPAYAGLADSYNLMPQYSVMLASEAFPRAKAAAERAVRLAPQSADAQRALAFTTFWWDHDVPRAMAAFQTAIRLDPNSAQSYLWYANALSQAGDDPEALASIEKARALDPKSTAIRASEGVILKNAGRFAEAKLVLQEVETAHPGYSSAYDYLASMLIQEGDDLGFLQQKEKSAQLRKDWDTVQVLQGAQKALARGGHEAMLQELVRGDAALVRAGKKSAWELAIAEMRLGNRRQAIEALEQTATALDPNVVGLGKNSEFVALHGEPEFERLLVRVQSFQ